MNNYLVTISYLGGAYYGFERQKDKPSIQLSLEKALSYLLGYDNKIHGAGRTDRGVNALGQTFSFISKTPIKDLTSFMYAFNRLLSNDISIKSIKEVPLDFDARHSCSGKKYSYTFRHGNKNALTSQTIFELGYRKFDEELFKAAMNKFLGVHNFQNFTAKPVDKDGFIRDIKVINFVKQKEDENSYLLTTTLESNGFMTYQIRIMVGVALKVGYGQLPLSFIDEKLEQKERSIISYKAPANGLMLLEVKYE
jgi:tRNA pseudouridine38-40 synthase